jgi:hypothetical protein
LIIACLLPLQVAAGDYSALLQEAASALDNDFDNQWAFTETSIESELTTVARFNPANPRGERWHLLTVDGRSPTGEEIADFAEEKAEESWRSDDYEKDEPGNDVEEMVEPDSLQLIEETDEHWLFSFDPSEDDDEEEFLKFVDATLRIAKDGPYIEYIHMQNNKPFRPQFGVKVKEFVTRLVFGPAATGGPIVPLSVDIRIKARAFLVVGVDETFSTSFSDYEFVAIN